MSITQVHTTNTPPCTPPPNTPSPQQPLNKVTQHLHSLRPSINSLVGPQRQHRAQVSQPAAEAQDSTARQEKCSSTRTESPSFMSAQKGWTCLRAVGGHSTRHIAPAQTQVPKLCQTCTFCSPGRCTNQLPQTEASHYSGDNMQVSS